MGLNTLKNANDIHKTLKRASSFPEEKASGYSVLLLLDPHRRAM
jgi:hypothetical protein